MQLILLFQGPAVLIIRVRIKFILSNRSIKWVLLDGIENKIHPGDAMDKDLYHLPPEELKDVPRVAASLAEALEALDADREFLKKGDVFTDDQIDAYIELKKDDIQRLDMTPHPVEFEMYYSS